MCMGRKEKHLGNGVEVQVKVREMRVGGVDMVVEMEPRYDGQEHGQGRHHCLSRSQNAGGSVVMRPWESDRLVGVGNVNAGAVLGSGGGETSSGTGTVAGTRIVAKGSPGPDPSLVSSFQKVWDAEAHTPLQSSPTTFPPASPLCPSFRRQNLPNTMAPNN
ncbi:uncharacterized protein BDR25DRAFT_312640 [Lindgomyces ingoldianus]|uniref:Uncharacterized protein n=1 Tax=Lindgomyces ingoldianus TaxID=673940 RepID=A0ACB6R0E8_9PLEO|nr:uncharacterized protein BDR25DRAFT_312640 [Lindgomyces ingoldianus]KAF2472724.1 hypothetical protein BDR25DRAFT_312640 [Lindgomyces ingoldianus]